MYVGGVAGTNYGEILNCYNTGAVSGLGDVGGVVGINGGTITNCYNTGAVSGSGSVGGVVGFNEGTGTITNCYNTGAVNGTTNVGGVAGSNNNSGQISSCHNTGTVIGSASVGGVAGTNNSSITNCYNTGAVTGTSVNIGGVVGYNYSSITNCYNTGNVSGTDSYVGGVVGYNSAAITNCYYYGYNVGVGGTSASQTGTTPFVKITDNPLGTGKTTTIIEDTTATTSLNDADKFGADFAVTFSDTYSSSDTGVATVSGTTITGVAAGDPTISGRTFTITQNELTDTGFTGTTTKKITVPISITLSVTADGGGATTTSAPTSTTNAAASISTTAATLNGTVNANGASTTVSFQYGLTTSYGSLLSTASPSSVTGNSSTSVSASLSGLNENTTYHFRVVANNSQGTTNGSDMTFTTASEPKYTVTYNGNTNTGGTVPTDASAYPNGSEVTLAGNTGSLAKTGYTFGGWSTTANGTAISTYTMGTDNATLYTVWTPVLTYTVTFDSNGGTLISNITNIVSGSTISSPTAPTKSGYTFAGWYKENGIITVWNFATDTVTADATLYAKWTANQTSPDPTPDPTPQPTPTPTPKTVEVIETPAAIKNPELISFKPVGEAFSQSVEVRIKDNPTVKKAIEDSLDKVLKEQVKNVTVFPLDISIYVKGTETKVQPATGTSVTITIPIPESMLATKDKIKVVCIIDGKLTVLETKVVLIDGVYCVQFTATHFSPYAMVVDTTSVLTIGTMTADTATKTNDKENPKTDGSSSILPIALLAIVSSTTLAVVSKKRKFKVVK